MSRLNKNSVASLVYDGACPISRHIAELFRVKDAAGAVVLVNAREVVDAPLVTDINRLGFDLDDGMVIHADGQFYAGKYALMFVARHGEINSLLIAAIKTLCGWGVLAQLMHTLLNGLCHWGLRRQNIAGIDNLGCKHQPTFKSIFGQDWDDLPPVMQKHYSNHPYTTEVATVKGRLDVFCKPPLLWLAPVMRWLGQIPTYNLTDVPVTVKFESDLNSKAFHFNRSFHIPDSTTYVFHSRMLQIKDNEVVEVMKFGIAWKMKYSWDGEKVILAHNGYAFHAFGCFIPLPLTLLMGAGNAVEYPIDDHTFAMEVSITHPWWGKYYGYKGHFEVVS